MCLGSKPCDCLTRVRGRGTDGVDGGWLRRYRFAIGAVSQLSHARNAIATGKAHRVPRRLSHPFRTRTAGHRPSREGDESDGDTIADSLDTLSDRVEVLEEANGTPPDHHQTTETTIDPTETTVGWHQLPTSSNGRRDSVRWPDTVAIEHSRPIHWTTTVRGSFADPITDSNHPSRWP